MNAAKADGSGQCRKFRELQNEYSAEHTKVPTGLVEVVWMSRHDITLKLQLKEGDRMSQKTPHKLQVASNGVLKTQHLALQKPTEVCLHLQQLKA